MARLTLASLLSILWLVPAVCRGEEPATQKAVAISGQVVDEQSQGVAGVKLTALTYTDVVHATTDEQGHFTLDLAGRGVPVILADDPGADRLGIHSSYFKPPTDAPLKIVLAKSLRVPVEVLDADGKPAAGVSVGAVLSRSLPTVATDAAGKAELRLPRGEKINWIYAIQPDVGFDFRMVATTEKGAEQNWLKDLPVRLQLAKSQTIRIRLVDSADKPIVETPLSLWTVYKPGDRRGFNASITPNLFRTTTDADGVAVFRVPEGNETPLTFWPANDHFSHQRIQFDPKKHPDGNLTVKLNRRVTAQGQVLMADGKAAAGIQITANGAGYTLDRCHEVATTDDAGHFEMRIDPDQLYMFAVTDKKWAAPVIDGIAAASDKPIEGLKFELRPATRVHGRVTAGPDARPVAGQRMSLTQQGRDLHNLEGVSLPNPENSRLWVQPHIAQWGTTDEKGEFEFFAGPGVFRLSGPTQVEAKKFEVTDEQELELNFAAPRNEKGPFAVTVVTGQPPRPVGGATVEGVYRAQVQPDDLRMKTDDQGKFSGERALHRTVLYAKSADGKLAGIVQIEPDDKAATISIGPLASIKARLIDAVTGNPLPNTNVQWGRAVHLGDDNAPWRQAFGGRTTTDAEGNFEATGFVPGEEYSVAVPHERGLTNVLKFTPEEAGSKDVGDLRRNSAPPPYKPPTLAERIDRMFLPNRPIADRYETAVKEAPLFRQNVLVIFLERGKPVTESWFKLTLEDRKVRTELYNFKVLAIDAKAEGAAALAERLGVEIAVGKLPAWAFRDADGHALEAGKVPVDEVDGLVNRTAVLEKLKQFTPEPLDAPQLLKDALADAAKTNRRVIVQETATWCGPCHLLALYLDAHRNLWEKDFIWIRMDQRWTDSDEVMDKFQEKRGGIPWCVILDAEGKTLATSDGPDGNIGFPSDEAGIKHFMTMLQSTKQRLTDEDLAGLRKDLEKK